MNKIPVTNKGTSPMSVGTSVVLPGETRHFDVQDVPHHLRPKAAEAAPVAAPADPLGELLKGNVASVVAALADLPLADVEKLGELEQAGQHRKTLLAAIAEELLNRAANADMLAKVAALGDEALSAELEAVLSDVAADPDYLLALEAEAAKRNPGAAA